MFFIFLLILAFRNVVAAAAEPTLIFFHGLNSNTTYELAEAEQILLHPKFKKLDETVLYIHGYVESAHSSTVQLIAKSYIKRRTHNILVLDWSGLVNGSYVTAIKNSKEIGPKIATILLNLFRRGLKPFSLHLVGHSLGGQLSGIIGRSVIQQSQNRIKLLRISALDPALPLFYPATNETVPINVNDAVLVDIIHTDAGVYGAPINTGCVDFVVNGGTRLQPGCPVGNFTVLSADDTCSHQRSVALWAESVSSFRPTFLATNSKFPLFKVNMGIDCPIIVSIFPGTYLVETNSEPPYSITPKLF